MTIQEEVQLAIDMGIESTLDFVYLAKANYCEGYHDDYYLGLFNNRLVKISCVESYYKFPSFGHDLSLELPLGLPYKMNGRKIIGSWTKSQCNYDERINDCFPDKYFTDELFKINYELKRMEEFIGYFQTRRRESLGDKVYLSYIDSVLSEAYNEEYVLKKRVDFIKRPSSDYINKLLDVKNTKFINLVDVVKSYGIVPIKTGQGRYKIICPFHSDHNPSCTIFENNRYKCFSCGASGDVADFVKNYEKITLYQAVQKLSNFNY